MGIYLLAAISLILCVIFYREEGKKFFWKKFDKRPFNFPFKYKGRTLWYSRACAVAGFIFCKNTLGGWCILANQRGKGAPDYNFFWSASCGYLDHNETLEEAMVRELKEECGIDFPKEKLILYNINSNPSGNKQNVTTRFYAKIDDKITDDATLEPFITNLGEKDEVADVRWIPIADLKEYNWAFNHKEIIEEIFDNKIVAEN